MERPPAPPVPDGVEADLEGYRVRHVPVTAPMRWVAALTSLLLVTVAWAAAFNLVGMSLDLCIFLAFVLTVYLPLLRFVRRLFEAQVVVTSRAVRLELTMGGRAVSRRTVALSDVGEVVHDVDDVAEGGQVQLHALILRGEGEDVARVDGLSMAQATWLYDVLQTRLSATAKGGEAPDELQRLVGRAARAKTPEGPR